MRQEEDVKVKCDPITGLCEIVPYTETKAPIVWKEGEEIIYIGDPMCSWCWGISPALNALQRYSATQRIPFTIVMGGLRPGGGEEWNEEFKGFLKHHWEEVNKKSGQPFGYDLFDQTSFNYDTEPACRGLVTAREMAPKKALAFYELVQYYFYVKSHDPNRVAFYQPICEQLGIDFEQFSLLFKSEDMKAKTVADFNLSRQWGIRAFPSVVYRKDDQLHLIAQGYATYEDLKKSVRR